MQQYMLSVYKFKLSQFTVTLNNPKISTLLRVALARDQGNKILTIFPPRFKFGPEAKPEIMWVALS